MNIYTHADFYKSYCDDYVSQYVYMDLIIDRIKNQYNIIQCIKADDNIINQIHEEDCVLGVREKGIYDIAILGAGGAIQAAKDSIVNKRSFACIRPGGHHASSDKYWGQCYFNNIAISLQYLFNYNLINTAFILDFDYHFGDGTFNIFKDNEDVEVFNPSGLDRIEYLRQIKEKLDSVNVDIIAVSAGFDNHIQDICAGILKTEDYFEIGTLIKNAALKNSSFYYGVLEGGYNNDILSECVSLFLNGFK